VSSIISHCQIIRTIQSKLLHGRSVHLNTISTCLGRIQPCKNRYT